MIAVHWIDEYPEKNWFGNGIEVWQPIKDAVASDFMFTDRVLCRCAHVTTSMVLQANELETVSIIVPIVK